MFRQEPQRWQLVIVDAVMPKANGMAVWRTIAALAPELPVLFISGHDRNVFPQDFFADERRVLLPKPFRPNRLLRHVRRLLDAGGPDPS